MREEFLIERHGKQYVLFAGLLETAHATGLHSIDTLLVQAPNEKNGHVAIVFAKVTMGTDEEPGDRPYFTGIGDASPENVGKNIAPHLIRMAETRAKARALRDAVNVGVTAFEELGDSSSQDAPESPRQAAPTPALKSVLDASEREVLDASERLQDATSEEPASATEAQREMLRVLLTEWAEMQRGDPEKAIAVFEKRNGPIEVLTAEQANEHIERLSERVGSPE